MTTATMPNGKPQRKQLSDQLDRLDGILDALSDGLNGAVADAARDGVRLAVKDAVIELLTDPTLRARLHEASAPEPSPAPAAPVPKPGLGARLKAKAAQAVQTLATMATEVAAVVVRGGQRIAATAAEGLRAVRSFGRVKTLTLVGLGVGLAVGAASFLARHAVTGAVSAFCGAVATVAVQLNAWTRRTFRGLLTA
jgi:hypothetical protein